MVQQLRAEDKLCLVTFDHEVNPHHTITCLISRPLAMKEPGDKTMQLP